MKRYNKLVRDNVPDILTDKGVDFDSITAPDDSIEFVLDWKLCRVVMDFIKDKNMANLADIYEILDETANYLGWDKDAVVGVQENIREEKGPYKEKIIIRSLED